MQAHRNALNIAAMVCLIAAVIHGLWYRYIPTYPAMASLTATQLDVVLLMNAAITLFLFVMGVATLSVARATTLSLRHVRAFSLFLIAFWAGRLLLEILMPLQIPLLFIENPGVIAKAVMAAPVVILGVPFLFSARRFQQ